MLISVLGNVDNTSIGVLEQTAAPNSPPVHLTADQPVMLMVTNNGSTSSTISASLPVAD